MKSKPKSVRELTGTELSKEIKNRKSQFHLSCILFGLVCGIALYATFRNGFGLLTFIPLLFYPMMAPVNMKYREVKSEMERREDNG